MTTTDSLKVIRESNYYSEIRGSIDSNNNSQFDLLLSMVCRDATQLDEFHQHRSESPKDVNDLNANLHVQTKRIVGGFNLAVEQSNAIAQSQQSVKTIHLNNCLNPAPLVADVYDLPGEVFENMDLNQRALALLADKSEQKESEPSAETDSASNSFDSNAWFNVLASARTLSQMA